MFFLSDSSANFNRTKGARDKKKRSHLGRNIAIGVGGTVVLGAAATALHLHGLNRQAKKVMENGAEGIDMRSGLMKTIGDLHVKPWKDSYEAFEKRRPIVQQEIKKAQSTGRALTTEELEENTRMYNERKFKNTQKGRIKSAQRLSAPYPEFHDAQLAINLNARNKGNRQERKEVARRIKAMFGH